MPTLVWADGFEYGLATAYRSDSTLTGEMYERANAQGAGTSITVAAGSRPGSASEYQLQLAAGSTDSNYVYVEKILASGAARYGVHSVYVKLSAQPSQDVMIVSCGNIASGVFSDVMVGSGGQLKLRARTVDSPTNMTGVTMTAGTWYRIEHWVDYGASGTVTYQAKMRVWAVDATTGAETEQGSELTVNAGGTNTAATIDAFTVQADFDVSLAASITVTFDDWVCSSTSADYPIGQHEVLRADVTGTGTHSFTAGDFDKTSNSGGAWTALDQPETAGTPGLSYTLVDEIPWDNADADWVRQDVIRSTGYLEWTLEDIVDRLGNDPWGVMIACFVKMASAASGSFGMRLATSGTESTSGNLSTTSSSTSRTHKAAFQATKPGGGSWTVTDFNSTTARWGYSGDVTPNPQLSAICVQYARQTGPASDPPVSRARITNGLVMR